MSDQQKLWDLVQKFILDQKITCPETICQTDNVITNAYEFIENCCNIVGYLKNEDEDEDD